jgi:hypothetical protein
VELVFDISGDVVEWQDLLNGTCIATLEGASADGQWTLSGSVAWDTRSGSHAVEGDITLGAADGSDFWNARLWRRRRGGEDDAADAGYACAPVRHRRRLGRVDRLRARPAGQLAGEVSGPLIITLARPDRTFGSGSGLGSRPTLSHARHAPTSMRCCATARNATCPRLSPRRARRLPARPDVRSSSMRHRCTGIPRSRSMACSRGPSARSVAQPG